VLLRLLLSPPLALALLLLVRLLLQLLQGLLQQLHWQQSCFVRVAVQQEAVEL
jgi:hypothetical protein